MWAIDVDADYDHTNTSDLREAAEALHGLILVAPGRHSQACMAVHSGDGE